MDKKKTEAERRQARLAKALKTNLARRKARAKTLKPPAKPAKD
jgi:hypothetical protein